MGTTSSKTQNEENESQENAEQKKDIAILVNEMNELLELQRYWCSDPDWTLWSEIKSANARLSDQNKIMKFQEETYAYQIEALTDDCRHNISLANDQINMLETKLWNQKNENTAQKNLLTLKENDIIKCIEVKDI